ncbi:Hypothetical predicted protein [Paramuricea clavata]|uniref:Uncharacterized protein n=1 Tax=Paramuricea clavata TaxID=317549 RepID=A0A7D9DGN5_PARCT|nr:Hypothetical predicted protein [Paramuricea clavata]
MARLYNVYMLFALVIFASLIRVEALLCYARDYDQDVSRGGCTTERIKVKACLGKCPSKEIPIDHYPFFWNDCKCCTPTAQTYVSVELNCNTGKITVKVPSATHCACQNCGRF